MDNNSKQGDVDPGTAGSTPVAGFGDPIHSDWVQPPSPELASALAPIAEGKDMSAGQALDTMLKGVVITFRDMPPAELAAGLRSAILQIGQPVPMPQVGAEVLAHLYYTASRLLEALDPSDLPGDADQALIGALDIAEDTLVAGRRAR